MVTKAHQDSPQRIDAVAAMVALARAQIVLKTRTPRVFGKSWA